MSPNKQNKLAKDKVNSFTDLHGEVVKRIDRHNRLYNKVNTETLAKAWSSC